jgi:predicted PurR-regulated permease PerM
MSAQYLKAWACGALVVVLVLTVWFASNIFLMAFAGILFAIMLRTASDTIARLTNLGAGVSLAITSIAILALASMAGWFVAPNMSAEIDQLRTDLPSAWGQLTAWLHKSQWAGDLVDRIQRGGLSYRQAAGHFLSAFSTLVSVLGGIVVVLFLGLYFAAEPRLYLKGILKLVPKRAEQRGDEVLCRTGQQLRHWLFGKLLLMAFVGISTSIGLWWLNMPLILSLATLAALLDFIPNIGPIISAVPALLIAFTKSPITALEIFALYVAVQVVESYILQPLVQKRAVSLPPSVTLLSQVLVGSLFGSLGLILATPLTVAGLTMLNMLYVEDILKKRPTT